MRMSFVAAAAMAAALGCVEPAPANAASCDQMSGKRVTMSGVIDKVEEVEIFIYAVVFTDTRTGCRILMLEIAPDDACSPGRGIVATGALKKSIWAKGAYDLDRGDKPPPGTLTCR